MKPTSEDHGLHMIRVGRKVGTLMRSLAAVACVAGGLIRPAAAADADLKFLERRNLDYPQSTPLPMQQTSWKVREHNKQVVLDFYKIISDKRQWTPENARKYFWPDFIQHDPAEPDTSSAFFAFFNTMRPPQNTAADAGTPPPPPGPRKQPGNYAVDSNGSPVNWMVAEGDIVVVARHRNWDWKDGPEPVYEGVFVDIWRVVDGKLKEQWCTATPADANLAHIREFIDKGTFPKTKE